MNVIALSHKLEPLVLWVRCLLLALGLAIVSGVKAADFTVTTPGGVSSYTINGMNNNPPLTLVRGRTYTFAVSTLSSHPFRINSTGASPNGISSGTITYTVPTNAANYSYVCVNHGFMTATITTTPPPQPPVPRIVSYSLTNDLVLRAAPATNTFVMTAEYKNDLVSTNWFALTIQSNRFANGTNEIFCGRPPGSNVFIRLKVASP